jgi:hypothetical protein
MTRKTTCALDGANTVILIFKNIAETSPSVFLKDGETCIVNLLSETMTVISAVTSDMI